MKKKYEDKKKENEDMKKENEDMKKEIEELINGGDANKKKDETPRKKEK